MTSIGVAWRSWPLAIRVGLVAAALAVLSAMLLLDPLGPATIDPDASSSVLYFQRIVGGRTLEAFVPTTPKPLLTLVYGVTWSLVHDWRVLVWETVAVWGVAVGATAAFAGLLADRVIGRIAPRRSAAGIGSPSISRGTQDPESPAATLAAGAFATAALLASSDLLLEVSRANSLIWALAGWSIAGVAVLLIPPRPRLAGLALLVAGMCRFETLALAAVAVLAVIVLWRRRSGEARLVPAIAETGDQFRDRANEVARRRRTGPLVGAALAVGALPVALLHDWLLAGDPLYWLSVPARYTEIFNPGLQSVGPGAFLGTIVSRIAPEWLLVVLAAIGVVQLVRARLWLPLAAIAAIGLGVVALLFWLAIRATYISNRYYEPIDLALVVAGAIGVGWIAWRLSADMAAAAAVPIVGVAALVLGAISTWPALPWDRRATTELATVRTASANAASLVSWIESLQANFTGVPFVPSGANPPARPATSFGLLVPSRDVSRLGVETGLGPDVIGDLYAAVLAGAPDTLRAGQWIIHDEAADRPSARFKVFEVNEPTGRVRPAVGTDIAGVWIDVILP